MVEIPLTNGGVTLVDDEGAERVLTGTWYKNKCYKRKYRETFYVCSTVTSAIKLHRFLLNAGPGQEVDHVDGNGLNNQRSSNLRLVTHAQNQRNRKISANNTSGCSGVWWSKREGKWIAVIKFSGKDVRLGCYAEIEKAISARKSAEEILW